MFKILATLLLVLATTAHDNTLVVADSTMTTHASMKVMSFNLRTSLAKDPCPSGCWDQRKHRVRKMLEQYAPDFIGTQEGAPDQIAFFESSLGYASVGECAGPCEANERNSIFYVKDRWQWLQGSTFALSDTPEKIPSNTWNLEYLRAAVLARFQHRATQNTVCMLNTHYDISRGQEQSSVLVAQRLAAFCQPTDTVVLTGDLNAPPNISATQYLANTTQLRGAFTPMPLYETLTAAGVPGATWIGGSFGNQTMGNKIDYIFARRDAQSCLRGAKIITDTFDGFSCSDHALIQSEFLIGAGCAQCAAAQ